MVAEVRAAVGLLGYQREDVDSAARFRWCCWARQTGKSFTKSLRRVLRGLERRRLQVFLSAGERQSRELMAKARQHCQTLQIATQYIDTAYFAGTSFRQLEIVLPRGVRIIGLPANPQTARGFSGDVLLDEFAQHEHDRQVWAALFPTLLRGDGELDVASTPRGRHNLFYKLRSNPRFATSTVTLPDAIAAGLDANLDELRSAMNDEELFRQEFLCEFLDEATAFLAYEQITACEDAALPKYTAPAVLARSGLELYLGVDVGRQRDLTVIWVLSREPGVSGQGPVVRGQGSVASAQWPVVSGEPPIARAFAPATLSSLSSSVPQSRVTRPLYVTRSVFELSHAPFREQQALLSELLAIRTLRRCCIDAGGLGMQLAEALVEDFGRQRVEAVTFTAALKSQLAGALRVSVEDGRIRIPADDAIRRDWHSLERSVTAAGQMRFDAGRSGGSHADRFWAAALAVHAAADPSGPLEWVSIGRALWGREGTW